VSDNLKKKETGGGKMGEAIEDISVDEDMETTGEKA
jgi:hypothetical protein